WITHAAFPYLQDGANVGSVSSGAGRIGIAAGRNLYDATKATVDSFTRSWALELAHRKIRVNAVAPGYVESDMTSKYFSDPEVLRRAIERSPFGRLGNADEVADVVLFLCSPAAHWITVQSLHFSGAFVILVVIARPPL